MSLKSKDTDFVSADRNWRSSILNELRAAQQWEDDWGFLASGNVAENLSLDEKIRRLEGRLGALQESEFRTTAHVYGKGADLEHYRVTQFNLTKNPELRPCDRKPKRKTK